MLSEKDDIGKIVDRAASKFNCVSAIEVPHCNSLGVSEPSPAPYASKTRVLLEVGKAATLDNNNDLVLPVARVFIELCEFAFQPYCSPG